MATFKNGAKLQKVQMAMLDTDVQDKFTGYDTSLAEIAALAPKPSGGDDTTAIQNVINSLTSGGIVYIPSGTFIVSTIQLPSNVSLIGKGMGVTILQQKVGTAAPILQNNNLTSGNTKIYVEGITIDGNKANQTVGSIGAFFKNISNSFFNRVEVKNINNNATGQALSGYSAGTIGGFHFESCTNITVLYSIISNCVNEGLRFLAGEDLTAYRCISTFNGQSGFATANLCKKGKFIQCIATDNTYSNLSINGNYNQIVGCYSTRSTSGSGINVGHQFSDGSANADYSIVKDNVVENITNVGIGIQNSINVMIRDNVVTNCNQNILGTNGALDGLSIIDNTCAGGGTQDSVSVLPYDQLNPSNTGITAKNVTIRGNKISKSNRHGIHLKKLQYFNVLENEVFDNSQSVTNSVGIYVEDADGVGVSYGKFANNMCYDDQVTKTQNYGIYITNATVNDNMIIRDNILSNNKTDGLYQTGANNIVSNNIY